MAVPPTPGSPHHLAVVVGGTSGIGLAIAQELVRRGLRVVVTGYRAHQIVAAQALLGDAAVVVRSDVTSREDRAELAQVVRDDLGAIDALFVNAGAAEPEPFDQVTEASWDRQLDVNTKGVFFTAQQLLPLVRDGGGAVFTTVSPATAGAGMSVTLAAKAAVRELARGLAAELVTRGVRVTTVAPGFVDTPSLGMAQPDPAALAGYQEMGVAYTPMKRLGTAAEVARAAVFLALDATFSTGVELVVDGGLASIDPPE